MGLGFGLYTFRVFFSTIGVFAMGLGFGL